ncbi:KpsF/GutQ family sugar-phosphate isomerase [Opitutales bacterium ASA1]|uniref:KpsF/GutQ family sugar-phosphate isomerase n=1 Tax=Congregicoccus parvus TaxID=3081749 RepID=UPI002B28DFFC|nr:KpsF/GutQ family sugar-phosphate isomerase [Opitutales bacterium ASA1]
MPIYLRATIDGEKSTIMNEEQSSLLERGRRCITIEAEALLATAQALDESFTAAVAILERTIRSGRKIIFSGVGKSAHIAQKLVGTFNSIGAPSCYLDPVNARHGDLGLCSEGDAAVLLSNSGTTEELVRLLPLLRRFGLVAVVLTGHPTSTLARAADATLAYRVPREACPLELAPTASSTAALALGDAVAMALLENRGFTKEDFARLHPAGNLGRTLLMRVSDVMRTGEHFPVLPHDKTIQDAIVAMTRAKAGCLALVEPADGRLAGVFTDGDFRRSALSGPDFLLAPVGRFMTRKPIVVAADALAVDALKIFEASKIDDLLVVDSEDRPVGLVDGQDLPRFHLV